MNKPFLTLALILLFAGSASANPTQFGTTGLMSVPSADTIDAGNICIGLWGSGCDGPAGSSVILPATLTLGLGSFWEAYGTYPNVLLNGKESGSGRGTADIGSKLRFYGKRKDNFKLSGDVFLSRAISDDLRINGTTDIGGRIIASYRADQISAHAYSGYLALGDNPERTKSYEIPFGLGLEYNPGQRSKVTLEIIGRDVKDYADSPVEASAGFRFYFSPHLTLNLAAGAGINQAAPDWRILFGFSTCQGLGNYIKPIPRIQTQDEGPDKKKDIIKRVKIIPLTPLLVKAPTAPAPVSKFEVPVDPDREEIVIKPYGQILVQQQPVPTSATPVALPPNILLEQVEDSSDSLEDAVRPSERKLDRESRALEYTINRITGTTPTYGVGVEHEAEPVKWTKSSDTVSVYKKFRLPDTIFEFGQSELSPEVKKALAEIGEIIRKDSRWAYLRVDGHTDSIGSVRYNLDLSLKRAIAVANYLITREGVDPARIFVKGMGKSVPISDNRTDDGRRQNRRFEILFLVDKAK